MPIDILYFLLLFIALIKGSRKGLIVAVFSLVGLVIGLVVALKFSGAVANLLKNEFSQLGFWAPAVAFALVFIGVLLLIRILAAIVETAVSAIQLGWLKMFFIQMMILLTTNKNGREVMVNVVGSM